MRSRESAVGIYLAVLSHGTALAARQAFVLLPEDKLSRAPATCSLILPDCFSGSLSVENSRQTCFVFQIGRCLETTLENNLRVTMDDFFFKSSIQLANPE